MTTALIADDEPLLAASLAARLKALWPALDIVAVAANGVEAVAALNAHRPDLAFLDIRMPGLTGLQVAQAARDTRVVFVTAYDEYALSAFEHAAIDYLLKPVDDVRLAQCVSRLQRQTQAPPDLQAALAALNPAPAASSLAWLTVGLGDTTRLVALDEVLYFEASNKYTNVVTATERHLIRTPLKDLLPQLDPQRFAQVHRAVIVNLGAVARIHRDLLGRQQVHLKQCADVLPLSRGFAGRFRQM
ncbi:LytR/AlgR family response regulator transcription factor [Jeongeupia naejangsanensis]|uniref:Response regulator transcription factor n=1 Tax=Jeongeupia naejangsanensis TaxID=613195 RepID=A0ABS2BQ78_9NEIS|nr:LytTR family DNA-binding domain-containing protein [Jeongeupia naejangsanensis]MBM3117777.1 response regulator transcription factor [Jeongeupia naejangsanensis]